MLAWFEWVGFGLSEFSLACCATKNIFTSTWKHSPASYFTIHNCLYRVGAVPYSGQAGCDAGVNVVAWPLFAGERVHRAERSSLD